MSEQRLGEFWEMVSLQRLLTIFRWLGYLSKQTERRNNKACYFYFDPSSKIARKTNAIYLFLVIIPEHMSRDLISLWIESLRENCV
jgi:hypothetical protein